MRSHGTHSCQPVIRECGRRRRASHLFEISDPGLEMLLWNEVVLREFAHPTLKVLSQKESSAHANKRLRGNSFADVMKPRVEGGFGHMFGFPSLPYLVLRECLSGDFRGGSSSKVSRSPEWRATAWHSSETASPSGRKRCRGSLIMEEVASELVGDGVPAAQVRSTEMRTRLAQRLLGLSRFWWTDTQIKQLLLRTLRNEASASRIAGPDGRGGG